MSDDAADPDLSEHPLAGLVQSIREPLHAVLGLAEILAQTETSIEPGDPTARVLHGEAQRVAAIVTEMLGHVGERPSNESSKLEVLVVDDSLINQLLTASQLEELGHSATVASSGPEAIEQLAKDRFDIVLMDWHMPSVDGLETTRRIRRSELDTGAQPTPIIAVTARAMIGDREQCLEAGMNDFLPKPVSLDELSAMLERWSGGQAALSPAVSASTVAAPAAQASANVRATTDPSSAPLVNHTVLDRMRADVGTETLDRLLDTYLSELSDRADAIRAGSTSGDWKLVRRAAHTLRSTSTLIGAERLAELADELERSIHDGGTDAALADATAACAADTEAALRQLDGNDS